jgi:hypothetical protein
MDLGHIFARVTRAGAASGAPTKRIAASADFVAETRTRSHGNGDVQSYGYIHGNGNVHGYGNVKCGPA